MIDFDALLAPAVQSTFGQDVTYTRKTPIPDDSEWDTETVLTLAVVLDASEQTQLRTSGAMEAWVRESDFGGVPPAKGDYFSTDDGLTYTVMDVKPASSLPADEGGRRLEVRQARA